MVRLDGKTIDQADSAKLLGVALDQTLSWENHIDFIAKNVASFCYTPKRLHTITTAEICTTFYYGQFLSKAICRIICWWCSTSAQRILLLQKRAIRNLYGIRCYGTCRDAFKRERLLRIPSIHIFKCILYVKEHLQQFTSHRDNHDYFATHNADLQIPWYRL